MDIHGQNEFKAKSYSAAAYSIEKIPVELSEIDPAKYATYKGIGNSAAEKIRELFDFGEIKLLKQLIEQTPTGIMEMMAIKGLGPKKIAVIWKELGIESPGELLYACEENRLAAVKGFGEKSQATIKDNIEFFFKNKNIFLYADVASFIEEVDQRLKAVFHEQRFAVTGAFRRQMEIVQEAEWVTTAGITPLKDELSKHDFETEEETSNSILFKSEAGLRLKFYIANEHNFGTRLFETSCSEQFLERWGAVQEAADETTIFQSKNIAFIPSFYREELNTAPLPDFIQTSSVKGIIHSHSNWSDGSNTIEEMAQECIKRGLEYLVISDHSKAAHYANGLNEDRIRAQHALIDELNEKLQPFKIFKSIECDILGEGQLDYDEKTLESFDLVIASVHSNLRMSEEKAMMRLLNAINNPFTTILGHMTGRLLLSRKGYPVNHEQIIRACADSGVVIELNAHPRRLDIDWRYIKTAIEHNVLISINPDAHALSGFDDIKYGVLVAQKAGLTAKQNLSSFSRAEMESYLRNRRDHIQKL